MLMYYLSGEVLDRYTSANKARTVLPFPAHVNPKQTVVLAGKCKRRRMFTGFFCIFVKNRASGIQVFLQLNKIYRNIIIDKKQSTATDVVREWCHKHNPFFCHGS